MEGSTRERETTRKGIYQIFDDFLTKTVINGNLSFESNIKEDKGIFNEKNLEILRDKYVNEPIFNTKDDNSKQNFEQKFREQLKDNDSVNYSNARLVFGNLMWLQYLPAKKPKKGNIFGDDKAKKIKNLTGLENVSYSCDGRAKYGMAAMQLDADMADLILLFSQLVKLENKKLENIKAYIIRWCLDLKDDNTFSRDNDGNSEGIRTTSYKDACRDKRKCPDELLPIHNMLLHLCKPEYYDDISVSGHKKKISETFDALISRKKDGDYDFAGLPNDFYDDDRNYNKKYYIILNKIHKAKSKGDNKLISLTEIEESKTQTRIYDYKNIWNAGKDTDFNDVNALKLKKAIILYGPPGTSKTYSATSLAQNLVLKCNYKPKEILTYIKDNKDKKYIHHLQLHPNYTYEDFIWGYQIENTLYDNIGKTIKNPSNNFHCVGNRTVAKSGYFLRLLKEMKQDPSKSHVLILDEINRVDLSRLFGELFSAIENRGVAVDLPVLIEDYGTKVQNSYGLEVSQVVIPDNLYIIGTMNEIDFSLESVDFALRRRFLWLLYGYDATALRDIIDYKVKYVNAKQRVLESIEWDNYCETCTKLNEAIRENPELGPKYEIGHTFFAEIVDIITETDIPTNKGMLTTAKKTLWNISIRPMLEAFFGKCTEDTKKKYLKPANGKKEGKDDWLDDIFCPSEKN